MSSPRTTLIGPAGPSGEWLKAELGKLTVVFCKRLDHFRVLLDISSSSDGTGVAAWKALHFEVWSSKAESIAVRERWALSRVPIPTTSGQYYISGGLRAE